MGARTFEARGSPCSKSCKVELRMNLQFSLSKTLSVETIGPKVEDISLAGELCLKKEEGEEGDELAKGLLSPSKISGLRKLDLEEEDILVIKE